MSLHLKTFDFKSFKVYDHKIFDLFFFSVKHRDRIDRFIDENKALMKRMYGDFEMMENGPFPKAKRSTARKRRQDSSFSDNQSKPNKLPTRGQPADSGRYYSSCVIIPNIFTYEPL